MIFILFTGTMILISVFIDTRIGITLDFLQSSWPALAIQLIRFLNILFSLIMVSVWFTVLFKILPEASMSWDTAFSGGLPD